MVALVRSFPLLLLAALWTQSVAAQVGFGLKAGPVVSTLTKPLHRRAQTAVGYHGGALLTVPLRPRLSGQLEVLFARQGSQADSTTATGTLQDHTFLHGIAIPVGFAWALGEAGLQVEAGAQASLLLWATRERLVTAGNLVSSQSTITGTFRVTNRYRPTDFALLAGLGWRFASGLLLNLRATYGLRDVTAEAFTVPRRTAGQGTSRQLALQLAAGWRFGGS